MIMSDFDNAGGGNCGFYAMSLGLIDIIQKELIRGPSKTLINLGRYLPAGYSEDEFKTFDFASYAKNIGQYKQPFLNVLQQSLREITVSSFKDHLETAISEEKRREAENLTKVESTELFNQFNEIVLAKSNNTEIDKDFKDFNDLAHSPEVLALADSVVKTLNANPDWKQFNRYAKEEQLKKLGKTYVKDHLAVILKASEKIGQDAHWAKHCHLKAIAETLGVNLYVHGKINGDIIAGHPTITLNNIDNKHWTTSIDKPLAVRPSSPGSTPAMVKTLTPEAQEKQVIETLVAKAKDPESKKKYQTLLNELLTQAKDPNFFKKKNDGSNEDLAKELQEQEFKDAGLKP